MNDMTMTVTGWAAADAQLVLSRDEHGVDLCTFRVGHTPRYYNSAEGRWADRKTEWFDVKVFGDAALSVKRSIKKGQPVVVAGKLRTHDWQTSAGEARRSLELEASAVGHDLTRGVAEFSRATVAAGDAAEGRPADSDHADTASSTSDSAEPSVDEETSPAPEDSVEREPLSV
ncbi:single-stranded DNA-binding protein [Demequina sediminicola]|uniref:single-stranded DNA-binding protein n=1 Tax=Demequina sediminicola TaxID=1095026 RepID=UPI0007809991|nr:single-stranded DNA-binding protein [Demequina sediminicola]